MPSLVCLGVLIARRSARQAIPASPGASGRSVPPPEFPQQHAIHEPEIVRGSDGHTVVRFENDRLHWQESEGATHVLSYAHLTELRVQVRPSGDTRLVALEQGGRRWEVGLDATETARAQTILDRVDVRLAEPVVPSRTTPILQAAVAGVAICAIWVGHIMLAVVAMGAAFRSVATFFVAAGAASLGASVLVAHQAMTTGQIADAWPALLLAILGVALLAGAWRRREDDRNGLVNAGLAVLGLLVLMSLAAIAMRGGGAVGLNQASLATPSAAVLPLALAAALAFGPRRSLEACRDSNRPGRRDVWNCRQRHVSLCVRTRSVSGQRSAAASRDADRRSECRLHDSRHGERSALVTRRPPDRGVEAPGGCWCGDCLFGRSRHYVFGWYSRIRARADQRERRAIPR